MEQLRTLLNSVLDPEIPVITLNDLGVIRDLKQYGDQFKVTITPTYSGCPAVERMKDDLIAIAQMNGYQNIVVEVTYSPAWSTRWMSENGRDNLKQYGIAPPRCNCSNFSCDKSNRSVPCPRCDSKDTRLISQFGSTACKSLHQCNLCLEPFEHFKNH